MEYCTQLILPSCGLCTVSTELQRHLRLSAQVTSRPRVLTTRNSSFHVSGPLQCNERSLARSNSIRGWEVPGTLVPRPLLLRTETNSGVLEHLMMAVHMPVIQRDYSGNVTNVPVYEAVSNYQVLPLVEWQFLVSGFPQACSFLLKSRLTFDLHCIRKQLLDVYFQTLECLDV